MLLRIQYDTMKAIRVVLPRSKMVRDRVSFIRVGGGENGFGNF